LSFWHFAFPYIAYHKTEQQKLRAEQQVKAQISGKRSWIPFTSSASSSRSISAPLAPPSISTVQGVAKS